MIRHFFLDKVNTIVNKSYANLGLNPIMELNYGGDLISRGLLHFDENEILKLFEDKDIVNLDKVSFSLKMTNCFTVDGYPFDRRFKNKETFKQRASSFDVILFKLPCDFDEGRGFDYISDFWVKDNRAFNDKGSSWYFSKTGRVWPVDEEKIDFSNPNLNFQGHNIWIKEDDKKVKVNLEGGIYPIQYIIEQIDLFNNNEDSIIIGTQHFDFGCENLDIDITKYVLDILNGEKNNGLCLMFTPQIEHIISEVPQYVSFFTNNTNTFFHPYVECVYCEIIDDDRNSFTTDKENKLYLYVNDDGIPVNLDEIPTCSINDVEYPVQQAQKGVYFAQISTNSDEMSVGSVQYDLWSNLALNGVSLDDVEMEFEVQPTRRYISTNSKVSYKENFVPSIYGINDNETLTRNEVREIHVEFRKQYETEKIKIIDGAEYRLYTKDGDREIVVFPYNKIERAFLDNFFVLHTEDLVPGTYFVDIKIYSGRETKYYKEALKFKIASNVTERYE